MAANSSSSSFNYFYYCSDYNGVFLNSTAFTITNILVVLPLSLLVLYLGHQRWRQQCSFATTSHSDIFTYHFVVMELIYVLGFPFSICGRYFDLIELMTVGYFATSVSYPGQMSFHILTCIERYLAVVHPVIYLKLRQSGGVKIRNISIGCAWLQYCVWIGVEALYYPDVPYTPIFIFVVLCLVVVSFCSFSVLCVLIRPGPGEMGGERARVDQSKRRAFHTVTAVTGVLWMYFIGVCVFAALDNLYIISFMDGCVLLVSASWLSLPSSLVLPLLFLNRARKLVSCH